jgi:WD40 repeat protein
MIVFKAIAGEVTSLVFSPDGNFLAVGGHHTVCLWAIHARPALVHKWPGYFLGCPLVFSPDGRYLASGDGEGVWDLTTDGTLVLKTTDFCCALAFQPDGELAIFTEEARVVRVTIPSGRELPGAWEDELPATGGYVHALAGLAFDATGTRIARSFGVKGSRGHDSAIRIRETTSGTVQHELRSDFAYEHPRSLRFSPDGRLLAAGYGPVLRVWDLAGEKVLASYQPGQKHLRGLAFSPDSQRLATVSNDATVRLWSAPEWTESGGFDWQIGKLTCVDASADGCRMAAGSASGQVVVWDVD